MLNLRISAVPMCCKGPPSVFVEHDSDVDSNGDSFPELVSESDSDTDDSSLPDLHLDDAFAAMAA